MKTHPQLKRYFNDYAKHHKTQGNRITHMIGIPLIIMSTLGLLPFTAAVAAWGLLSAIYIFASPLLGFTMALSMAVLFFVGIQLPLMANMALFVFGWIFQFMGHYVYEKESPSFYKNIVHIFVGPLYIQKIVFRIRD